MALAWDYTVLPFQSFEATRRNLSRSGGLTIFGMEQVVQSSSDFWAINATVKIRTWDQILAYRALQAQSFGRATEWLIPVPISAGIFVQTRIITKSATEASFSSEFSPEFPEEDIREIVTQIPYPHVTGRMSSTALRSSSTISFTMDNPAWVPVPGIYFSIGSRLYMMATVVSSGTIFTGTFVPKLRANAVTGTTIEFSQPKCLMRLAQDNIGQMNLDMLKFADLSLNFVEVPA